MSDTPLYLTKSRLAELEVVVKNSIEKVLENWLLNANEIAVSSQKIIHEDALEFDKQSVCFHAEDDLIRLYLSKKHDLGGQLDLPVESGPIGDRLRIELENKLAKSICQSLTNTECEDFCESKILSLNSLKDHELMCDVIVDVSIESTKFILILKRKLAQKIIGKPKASDKGQLANRFECLKQENIEIGLFLESSKMSLHELSNLKVGQTLPLSANVSDPLQVRLGQKNVARAFIGKRDNYKALIIT